jgi:hypothetical protein
MDCLAAVEFLLFSLSGSQREGEEEKKGKKTNLVVFADKQVLTTASNTLGTSPHPAGAFSLSTSIVGLSGIP